MTADIGSDILNTVTVKTRDVPRLRYNADEQVLSALIKKFIRSYEKMSKKILKWILCGTAAVFGFISAMMLFAPALVDKVVGLVEFKGSDIAFGKEIMMGQGFAVSAYMLPLFLALIGVALMVVAALGKGGKIVPIVAAVCFIGAGICYFLPMVLATPSIPEGLEGELKSEYIKEFREGMKEAYKLAAGAIVGGIFSIIAAVVSVVPVFVCKD